MLAKTDRKKVAPPKILRHFTLSCPTMDCDEKTVEVEVGRGVEWSPIGGDVSGLWGGEEEGEVKARQLVVRDAQEEAERGRKRP